MFAHIYVAFFSPPAALRGLLWGGCALANTRHSVALRATNAGPLIVLVTTVESTQARNGSWRMVRTRGVGLFALCALLACPGKHAFFSYERGLDMTECYPSWLIHGHFNPSTAAAPAAINSSCSSIGSTAV